MAGTKWKGMKIMQAASTSATYSSAAAFTASSWSNTFHADPYLKTSAELHHEAFKMTIEQARALWLARFGDQFVSMNQLVADDSNADFYRIVAYRLTNANKIEIAHVDEVWHGRIAPE